MCFILADPVCMYQGIYFITKPLPKTRKKNHSPTTDSRQALRLAEKVVAAGILRRRSRCDFSVLYMNVGAATYLVGKAVKTQ